MTCRVARSFPNQTADTSEKGGRPVSNIPIRTSIHAVTTVLLIDAHKEDRAYWAHGLRTASSQYVVLEADTGAAALAMCQSQRVDCVVTELTLPDISGFQLLVRLVPVARHPEIAVIMMSRTRLLPMDELALSNGAQAALSKGITSAHELDIAIRKAVAAVAHAQA